MFRMNFRNRDMDVKVVRIVMDHTDTLMISEPEFSTKTSFDYLKSFWIRMFAGAERNKQVISAIGLGAGIELLGGDDLADRQVEIRGKAISDSHFPHPGVFTLVIDQIRNQLAEPAFPWRLHADLLGNHRGVKAL